ncbi:MAG: acetyltransferase [Rhodospirillaceae bacterium]|nr:acetyltransferase [Rhodospirillaceae bacterium]
MKRSNRRGGTGTSFELRGFLTTSLKTRGNRSWVIRCWGASIRREFADCRFINGIASESSYTRKPEIVARSGLARERFVTIIHPAASIARTAQIGLGTSIMANSVICPDAVIGDHVIILQNTVVNHHSRIADHVTLSSGITILGYVTVEDSAFVGGGASLRPYIRVGARALVGMGAVVVKDVAADETVAGNPAKVIRRKEKS